MLEACCICDGYSQPTTPVYKSRVKLRSQMMCVVGQNLIESVGKSSVIDYSSNISCCLPITPPAVLMVFSSLSLSCFEAFPPQQTQS